MFGLPNPISNPPNPKYRFYIYPISNPPNPKYRFYIIKGKSIFAVPIIKTII